jgi:hypothetical protein
MFGGRRIPRKQLKPRGTLLAPEWINCSLAGFAVKKWVAFDVDRHNSIGVGGGREGESGFGRREVLRAERRMNLLASRKKTPIAASRPFASLHRVESRCTGLYVQRKALAMPKLLP